MSTEDHTPEHEAPHEGPIKTPRQLIIALLLAFIVPVVVIIMLANYVASSAKPAAGSDRLSQEATASRVQPVGTVEIKDVSDPAAMKTGEQVFAAQCSVCHAAGVAGAPKVGDEAAWAPRIRTGFDTLLASALKGKGLMGPQAGGDHTDFEIARAVVHMTNQSGAKFAEPTMAAAAPAASN